MTNKPMYPYTYGDEGLGLQLGSTSKRLLKVIAIAIIPVVFLSSAALAVNNTVLLLEIIEKIEKLEKADTPTHPVSVVVHTAACIVVGACGHAIIMADKKKQVHTVIALSCGIAIAVCGERAVKAYYH